VLDEHDRQHGPRPVAIIELSRDFALLDALSTAQG
jgi:hypothetical protein